MMAETDDLSDRVELLTDEYAKKILAGCYQHPMTAQQLSWEYNMPIAATYRRLNDLEEAGFIEEAKEDKGGNKASSYRTSLEKAVLTFKDGKFSIKLKVDEEEVVTDF